MPVRPTTKAIAMRDHVLPLIQARGAIVRMPYRAGFISLTQWICTLDGETQPLDADQQMADGEPLIMFSLRTPFSNWFAGASKYGVALARQKGTLMSYGLDIWRPKKVLNMQWAERDEEFVGVITFKRGNWEEEVMGLK